MHLLKMTRFHEVESENVRGSSLESNQSQRDPCTFALNSACAEDIGWLKKVSFLHFQHYQDHLQYRFFYNENYRQSTISEQILKAFG